MQKDSHCKIDAKVLTRFLFTGKLLTEASPPSSQRGGFFVFFVFFVVFCFVFSGGGGGSCHAKMEVEFKSFCFVEQTKSNYLP